MKDVAKDETPVWGLLVGFCPKTFNSKQLLFNYLFYKREIWEGQVLKVGRGPSSR